MRAKRSLIFFFLIQLIFGETKAQLVIPIEKDTSSVIDEHNFITGEQIVYQLYYNWKFIWIPAGEVVFNLMDHGDQYLIHVTGASYPSYDSFFKVRDDYISLVDKETMLPQYFRRDIEEGGYIRYDSIAFDHSCGKLTEYVGKSKENFTETIVYEFEDQLSDLLTTIYQLRNLKNVTQANSWTIDMFFDKDPYHLNIEYEGIEKKKIKHIGKVETMHFVPELIAGSVFKENDRMHIWVTNDDNRLPLQIESPVTFGSVKAIIKSFKNLKYPTNFTIEKK